MCICLRSSFLNNNMNCKAVIGDINESHTTSFRQFETITTSTTGATTQWVLTIASTLSASSPIISSIDTATLERQPKATTTSVLDPQLRLYRATFSTTSAYTIESSHDVLTLDAIRDEKQDHILQPPGTEHHQGVAVHECLDRQDH